MANRLVQARYSPHTWADHATTDQADLSLPPGLVALFEKLGATFLGMWYLFGYTEYDVLAIVEVADSADVAALEIAARTGWDERVVRQDRHYSVVGSTGCGPGVGKCVVTAFGSGSPATHRAETAVISEPEHPRRALPPKASPAQPVCPNPSLMSPHAYPSLTAPTETVPYGHTREGIFDESDIVGRAEAEPPAPPASTQPRAATPPTQRARRRWKRPAAAATVAITVAVLVVGGYYGVKNATSATTKVQPPAAPVAAAQVPDLPLGAMACKKLYNDIQIPFDAGARGTPTTSCPFVEQVRRTSSS